MLVHSEQKEGSHVASVHARPVCGAKAAMEWLDSSQLSALRNPKVCYLFDCESTLGGHAFRNLPLFPIVFFGPPQLVTQVVTPTLISYIAATEKPCGCLSSDFFLRTQNATYEMMTSTLGALTHLLWRKLASCCAYIMERSCQAKGQSRAVRTLWVSWKVSPDHHDNFKPEDPGHTWASPGPHLGHTWISRPKTCEIHACCVLDGLLSTRRTNLYTVETSSSILFSLDNLLFLNHEWTLNLSSSSLHLFPCQCSWVLVCVCTCVCVCAVTCVWMRVEAWGWSQESSSVDLWAYSLK